MKSIYDYIREAKHSKAWEEKFQYVMKEFGDGKLKDPQGNVIKDQKQALAVAYSEANKHHPKG